MFHQTTVINAAAINARWGTGLEARHPQWQFPQPAGQGIGGRVTGATARIVGLADVYLAAEKGPGGQDHGRRTEGEPHLRHHPGYPLPFHQQVIDRLLKQGQVGLLLQTGADRALV